MADVMRYGYNDHEDGTTVLWEHGDGPLDPFKHIAEIHDWEAFTRWLATIRAQGVERASDELVKRDQFTERTLTILADLAKEISA